MSTNATIKRCALLLCLPQLLAAAYPDAVIPLPAAAEAARLQGNLTLLSKELHLHEDDPSLGEDCKSWKLTESGLRLFFQKAVPITGYKHHALYYVLPCEYTGFIDLGGTTYKFVLNGGSYAELHTLSAPVSVRLFGCRRGCEAITPYGAYPADGEEP